MDCKIENVYTYEECEEKRINRNIKNRIREFQSDEYIMKNSDWAYRILRKPNYKLNWIGRTRLKFEFDDKYHVLWFNVRKDTIIVDADNLENVEKAKLLITLFFGDIEGLKVKIRKQFCSWEHKK